jgi:beta-lactamase class A
MKIELSRRRALLALAALPLLPACAAPGADPALQSRFAALEQDLGGRLGVAAIDTGSGKLVTWRADERFAMCSTFKMMACGAVLARSVNEPALLAKRIPIAGGDLVPHSPVTEKHLADGMTLEQLCAATMITSDNAAANLILRELGGPAGLTQFARGIGDNTFRLDRYETELNSAMEGDLRDTSTPRAMMRSLQALVLGSALPPLQCKQLKDWLVACETGNQTIRAGVPADWVVGNRTGAGGFGSRNDIGIVWPPGRAPIVMAIFTVRRERGSAARHDIVAAAARIVAG